MFVSLVMFRNYGHAQYCMGCKWAKKFHFKNLGFLTIPSSTYILTTLLTHPLTKPKGKKNQSMSKSSCQTNNLQSKESPDILHKMPAKANANQPNVNNKSSRKETSHFPINLISHFFFI